MSSYILSLFKSIGEFAVEVAAAALNMDAFYCEVNRVFFSARQQCAIGLWMLFLYHTSVLLSVSSADHHRSLSYL